MAQSLLTLIHLGLSKLDPLVYLISKLIKGLLICLEGLLLPDEGEVLCRGFPSQLIIDILEIIFKLKFQCLHHLLHLYYLSLAVKDWLDLLPTWFIIKCTHCILLV